MTRNRPRVAVTTGGMAQPIGPVMRYIAYLRVSTNRQSESGAGIEAQRTAILAEAQRRGWNLADVHFIEEAASGKNARRPGLELAREALAKGKASALVVSKMDRLSRSLLDFASIMAEAQRQGWALIALDCPADPSTPTGEAVASIMATFAQLERRVIGERTRDALAEKRAAGVRLGRPLSLPASIRKRIASERKAGRSLAAIAEMLNEEQVPTAQGGRQWWPSTVRAVLHAA
jgi:DNA invertase Pin-like site-specific DNA recombinase